MSVRNRAIAATLAAGLIAPAEGCYTYAYRDPVGIPTICFGHIENVHMGDKSTKAGCEKLLVKDIPRYQAQVNACLNVPVSEYTYAALTSFTYNVGQGAFCKSTVARKINAGDLKDGCAALKMYVYAHKAGVRIKLPGLVTRRDHEYAYCMRAA